MLCAAEALFLLSPEQTSCRSAVASRLQRRSLVTRVETSAIVLALALLGATAGSVRAQTASAPEAEEKALFDEPRLVEKGAQLAEKYTAEREQKDGFFVETGNMITGSGWISVGPGYRMHLFGRRAVASASAAVSWRLYNMARGSLDVESDEKRPFSYGIGAMYQDALQVNFFGIGNDTTEAMRSGYRLQTFDVDGHGAWTRGAFALQGRVGWLPRVDIRSMAGRMPAYPDTIDVFDESTAPGIIVPTSFAHADLSATWDGRDRPGRPTRGGLYTASIARYNDLQRDRYTFALAQFEAAQYVPLVGSTWVAALHAWTALTRTPDQNAVPFYLMPNTGGKSTIRGFPDYRFYGPQMLTLSAESRVAVFAHVDVAIFVDAGRVADRVDALGLSGLQTAVGAGVRFHTRENTVARLDVANSSNGWFVIFKLTEPFKRKTFSGNLAPTVPFVP